MPLYFAYGSNMDLAAMSVRCPRSRALGPARLIGHRVFITRDGYASVMREPGRLVWGLLWDLALTDVPALDHYESLGTGLYAKVIRPVITDRGPRRAMIYVGRRREAGLPKPGYVEGIVAAAAQAGLPDLYLRELQAGLPTGSPDRTFAQSRR
jgi:AIG2-like family